MNAKEILAKIKAVFDGSPVAAPVFDAPPVETPATQQTISAYLVDGSGPVYVNNSDDGIPDIDSNDMVYSDAALTSPYPDGTYNVTGTSFGFTVAGGVVTAVNDVAGTGPGAPVDPATLAKPVVPTPPAAGPHQPPITLSAEEVQAMYAKFKTENIDPVSAALASAVMAMEAANKKIEAQDKVIAKYDEVIKGMFEFMEALAKEPTATPVTVPPQKKEKFDKAAKNEEKFEKYAKVLKEAREAKNAVATT
jgi:hypothetical protein